MLTPLEARILGALMEKQLTTPDAYPLTLNSLQLACNQKTNREPVINLQEGALQQCLYGLQDRKLVEFDYGARANKFNQRLARTLHFEKPEQAIICIMLLRGPQTSGELLSRCERLAKFSDSDDLRHCLHRLQQREPALVCQLPRAPGHREDRYAQLLCGPIDESEWLSAAASAAAACRKESPVAASASGSMTTRTSSDGRP